MGLACYKGPDYNNLNSFIQLKLYIYFIKNSYFNKRSIIFNINKI